MLVNRLGDQKFQYMPLVICRLLSVICLLKFFTCRDLQVEGGTPETNIIEGKALWHAATNWPGSGK